MDSAKCVAIIPARSGSKRIPNKNVKSFMGKPVISHAIRTSIESGLFDRVLVSTDSKEIAAISRDYGAEILELRPNTLADDYVSTMDVIKYELKNLRKHGYESEFASCIYPATPFLNCESLEAGLSILIESQADFCIPIVRNHVSADRMFKIDEKNFLNTSSISKENRRTQEYVDDYRDAGQFYIGKTSSWMIEDTIFSNKTIGLIVPEHLGIDIDTLEDWIFAEMVYVGKKYLSHE